MVPIQNFEFLIGKWTVTNKRLKERLRDCSDWEVFEAEMETKPLLNGLGVIDEMRSAHFGEAFVGLSIRLYDPATNVWCIYWADTANPALFLKEQVKGRFENGVGLFYGNELHRGVPYELRFEWCKPTHDTALWKQAYQDPVTKDWEVNWIMEFTAIQ